MRQNLVVQFIQLLKCWLCNMQSSGAVVENWALSVDQCWLQAFQFSVHLINLLSRILKRNGFTGIQKVVVDQMGSRPPVTMTYFGANLALGSALELLLTPTSELAVASCIKSTFGCRSQSDQYMFRCSCTE